MKRKETATQIFLRVICPRCMAQPYESCLTSRGLHYGKNKIAFNVHLDRQIRAARTRAIDFHNAGLDALCMDLRREGERG